MMSPPSPSRAEQLRRGAEQPRVEREVVEDALGFGRLAVSEIQGCTVTLPRFSVSAQKQIEKVPYRI
jgi:hypothetical protein